METAPPWGEGLRGDLGDVGAARRIGSSQRSRVWRVDLADGPAIVKQVVDGVDAAARYTREVAALRLAARADPPVVPALLATDAAARVFVLELVEHHPPPRDWVVGYAATLARLHAATHGGETADTAPVPTWCGPTEGDAESFLAFARALDVRIPRSAPGELADLIGRLGKPSGRALLHGDPCPGNDLYTASGVRFVDFERASLGDGLVELAYLRAAFPTCAYATAQPASLVDAAEDAYRDAWRAATGVEPAGDLVDACAGWMLQGDALVMGAERTGVDHLARLPEDDWTWGTGTARERLGHRLGVVARLAAYRPDLRGLSHLATETRMHMLARWPGMRPLPVLRPDGVSGTPTTP